MTALSLPVDCIELACVAPFAGPTAGRDGFAFGRTASSTVATMAFSSFEGRTEQSARVDPVLGMDRAFNRKDLEWIGLARRLLTV